MEKSMNARLEQDAADTLQAHEERANFKATERARWTRAQPPVIVGTWAPTMTERQRKAHEQYVAEHNLPF
jgi:hypothetical protein